jgi:hypothetical protein
MYTIRIRAPRRQIRDQPGTFGEPGRKFRPLPASRPHLAAWFVRRCLTAVCTSAWSSSRSAADTCSFTACRMDSPAAADSRRMALRMPCVMPPFQGLGRVLLRVSQGDALGWIKAAPLALKQSRFRTCGGNPRATFSGAMEPEFSPEGAVLIQPRASPWVNRTIILRKP